MKILLVDDEKDFLEIMGTRIRGWGCDLIKASDGKKALKALKTEAPDIVILDYMMPDMSGVEVLKEIRKINKTIPVIMFTAYPNMKTMEDTERLGISAFVPKLSAYTDTVNSLKVAVGIASKNLGTDNK
ncbi:MAG: response regulator [Candidatus Omnitrophota bacterium]|nr:response regulator [Candidatus Omnitrophota bacterium]